MRVDRICDDIDHGEQSGERVEDACEHLPRRTIDRCNSASLAGHASAETGTGAESMPSTWSRRLPMHSSPYNSGDVTRSATALKPQKDRIGAHTCKRLGVSVMDALVSWTWSNDKMTAAFLLCGSYMGLCTRYPHPQHSPSRAPQRDYSPWSAHGYSQRLVRRLTQMTRRATTKKVQYSANRRSQRISKRR
jgi:hypothetical protein